MSLIGCPNCGGRYAAILPACPHCETPTAVDRTSPTHDAAPGPAPARTSRPAASSFDLARELRWARNWAIASGSMILGGFLLPVVTSSQIEEAVMIWPWDWMKGLPIHNLLAYLAIPAQALVVLFTAILARRRVLPPFMVMLGFIALGIQVVLSPIGLVNLGLAKGVPGLQAGALGGIALAGVCAIAVGNRVRKSHPKRGAPRLIAGIGGIAMAAFLLIPFGGEAPVIAIFIDKSAWKDGAPFLLALAAYLAYAIAGIVSFRNFARPKKAAAVVTWLGRTLFAFVPIAFLTIGLSAARWVGLSGQESFAPLILVIVKLCAVWFGLMILPSAGAAAWMSASLGGGLSEPPAPKKHLKQRIRAIGTSGPPPPDVVI